MENRGWRCLHFPLWPCLLFFPLWKKHISVVCTKESSHSLAFPKCICLRERQWITYQLLTDMDSGPYAEEGWHPLWWIAMYLYQGEILNNVNKNITTFCASVVMKNCSDLRVHLGCQAFMLHIRNAPPEIRENPITLFTSFNSKLERSWKGFLCFEFSFFSL